MIVVAVVAAILFVGYVTWIPLAPRSTPISDEIEPMETPPESQSETSTVNPNDFNRADEIETGVAKDAAIDEKEFVLDESKELVSDAFIDATPDIIEWADNLYNSPTALVRARRYRFVKVDYELLHKELEMSPAYVAVVGGQGPPPVYSDSAPTFTISLFNDRRLGLLVTDVRFYGEIGERHIVLRGEVRGGGNGTFKLSLREGEENLRGQIRTPKYRTLIDTIKNSPVTTIAELDKSDIESSDVAID